MAIQVLSSEEQTLADTALELGIFLFGFVQSYVNIDHVSTEKLMAYWALNLSEMSSLMH